MRGNSPDSQSPVDDGRSTPRHGLREDALHLGSHVVRPCEFFHQLVDHAGLLLSHERPHAIQD